MAASLGCISNAKSAVKSWSLCGESDEIGEKRHQIEWRERGKRTKETQLDKKSHQA